jgi:hypothetical protein
VLKAFENQVATSNLKQNELAQRIRKGPDQINRWLGAPGNWTLDTISDLLLGIGVDLDDPSFTPIADLLVERDSITSLEGLAHKIAASPTVNTRESGSLARMASPDPVQLTARNTIAESRVAQQMVAASSLGVALEAAH